MSAICAESLSKVYRINRAAPDDLRSLLTNLVRGPLHRLRHGAAYSVETEEFWALRDVSFELATGEILGVIGRNGSGKSTLLKLLAQITEPTSGRAEIRGRVGCLLEVGTGFHPELSGRENVYLNGAILGMGRREVKRKFAEIAEFSGVERFLDTPVKRYSTGMRVRLGFAVAAHLEPEILIVDEVLSVGDAAFQKRCLGKMQGIARGGRTVVFVSHNMQAVASLCDRCLLLEQGVMDRMGETHAVIQAYLKSGTQEMAEVIFEESCAPGDDVTRLHAVRILNSQGKVSCEAPIHEPIMLEAEFDMLRAYRDISVSFHLLNHQETCIFAASSFQDPAWREELLTPGRYRAQCRIPANFLNDGRHIVSAFVVQERSRWPAHCQRAVSFHAYDAGVAGNGYTGGYLGVVRPLLPWTTTRIGGLS